MVSMIDARTAEHTDTHSFQTS